MEKLKFSDVFDDITRQGTKIQANQYLVCGKYQIIDQSQNDIAGYTNQEEGLFTDIPAIVFGDHTRVIKYVDKPCFLGADGVKLLRAKESKANYKYLYYVLTNAKIPDTGYNRHFKWLKEINIPLYDEETQNNIVKELEKVTNLIDKRKKQLEKLDELVKSRFIEMFGDPNSNEKGWTVSTLGEYMTLLTDFSANGSYELLDSNVVMYDEPNYAVMVRTTDLEAGNLTDGVKYIDRTAYELLSKSKLYGGELIMNKIGSAGKIYIMPQIDKPASLGRNAFMFRFDDRINMVYLYALLSSDYGTKEIQQYVRGAVTKTITKESTRSIRVTVPPIELQEQYATFVKQVDKSKFEIKQSLKMLELLKKALMQKYFG